MSILHSMSGTALGVVVMLLLMSLVSIGLAIEGCGTPRRQSRVFVKQAAAALDEEKIDTLISIAERNNKRSIASMLGTGLAEF